MFFRGICAISFALLGSCDIKTGTEKSTSQTASRVQPYQGGTVHQAALDLFSLVVPHPGREEDFAFLHRFVKQHPVAGLANVGKYDPSGVMGFCFGRAMAVELSSYRLGFAPGDVKKLFVIGDLRSGSAPEWRFHVTTVARTSDGKWWAIDPILSGPMPMERWIASIRGVWDKQAKANYYLTPPSGILPNLRTFRKPENEKGDQIIELSFNPLGKPGITPMPQIDNRLYAVDEKRTQQYFSATSTSARAQEFLFDKIQINNDEISFNNYFLDLTQSIATDGSLLPLRTESSVEPASVLEVQGNTFGSPRFAKFAQ